MYFLSVWKTARDSQEIQITPGGSRTVRLHHHSGQCGLALPSHRKQRKDDQPKDFLRS